MKKVPKLEGKGSLSEDAAVATGRARGNKGEDYEAYRGAGEAQRFDEMGYGETGVFHVKDFHIVGLFMRKGFFIGS